MAGTSLEAVSTATLYIRETDHNGLALTATCTGTPPTTASVFQHGAMIVQTDTASAAKSIFENTGTSAVPVWNLIGDATVGEITLTTGSILIGAAGVGSALDVKTSGQILVGNGTTATSVAVSGDATITSAGVVTVVGATGAFNFGTNTTWTKEVAHTSTVTDSTTANTAGAAYTMTGAKGTGTAAGGALSYVTGASSNGAGVNPGASGDFSISIGAAGTATTGTAGAAGGVSVTGAAGGASTGASSTGGAGSDVSFVAGAGGASSGGGDTGGRGGNMFLTSGAGGAGATAGRAGAIFARGPLSRKSISTTATDTTTLTMAQILSGTVRCTPTAAASYTMPTGTVIAAALPVAFTTGDTLDFVLCNVATNDTFDITLVTAASGTTLFGNLIVEANSAAAKWSSGIFRIECTGASAYNVIRIG